MPAATIYDVAVIGGGPAGLAASIWLARYLHTVVVIDSGDPRNWAARGVHGYLGLPNVPPDELRARGEEEAQSYGVDFVNGCVATAERTNEERFSLTLDDRQVIEARRVLLAIGIRDEWPDVPGLKPCYGETVHHCPDCDGYEAQGCKTVVIASGRKAVGMALALSTWTREIVICTNGAPPDIDADNLVKLDRLNIPVLTERIARTVHDDGAVRGLELSNQLVLDCERIFFAIGHYPADDLGVQLGCARDDEGLIEIDVHYRSSVLNVFAAGDVVPGPHLALAAAADGAMAAMAIHRSLIPEVQQITDSG